MLQERKRYNDARNSIVRKKEFEPLVGDPAVIGRQDGEGVSSWVHSVLIVAIILVPFPGSLIT